MDKRVVWNKCIPGIHFNIIRLLKKGQTIQEFEIDEGKDSILSKGLDISEYSYFDLCEKYKKFIGGGESECFSWIYLIKEGFGIIIDSHIYLCKYDVDVDNDLREVFEWGFIEGKHYLGDVWWFEDEEILDDIQHMSIIDFLDKYRGI